MLINKYFKYCHFNILSTSANDFGRTLSSEKTKEKNIYIWMSQSHCDIYLEYIWMSQSHCFPPVCLWNGIFLVKGCGYSHLLLSIMFNSSNWTLRFL